MTDAARVLSESPLSLSQAAKSRPVRNRKKGKPDGEAKPIATVGRSEAQCLAQLRLEWVDAESLDDNPRNWRRHPEKQMAALRDVIAEVGWAGALLYNEATGRLLDGHARKKLGGKVPVLIGSWTELQERTILATLDPLAAMAEADGPMLDALLREVDSNSENILAMLADLAKEHGILPEVAAGLTDPDYIPEPPDEARTQPGDLLFLGEHRLLCGDSGKAEDIERLLGGDAVHLVNTDPPYCVGVEPRSNNAIAAGLSSFAATHHQKLDVVRHPKKSKPTHKKLRPKDRPLVNDFLADKEFDRLLDAWFGNIARQQQAERSPRRQRRVFEARGMVHQ